MSGIHKILGIVRGKGVYRLVVIREFIKISMRKVINPLSKTVCNNRY